MKILIKKIFKTFGYPIDYFFSFFIVPSAYILLLYRMLGSSRLPLTTLRLKKIGVFPIRNHYYEPLFDDKLLSRSLDTDRYLPGIDLNVPSQLNILSHLTFSNELLSLNLEQSITAVDSFYINNDSFKSGDADFLYQIIRYIKPRKVIEIGSGSSTKIARLALKKNMSETNVAYRHICVEPYEQPWLEDLEGLTVIRSLIENTEFNWANELDAGDLLFVDSSHVIRPQGDVLKEYLEIFPQLKPGVIVHIHDIFTPKDYLKSWVIDDIRFWNEQYLLEALLTNTNRYEVIAALNFLKHNHYDKLKQVCPYLTKEREPGSFYFKVKA
jgi:predicted O-methyltransferase YrrM